MEFFDLGTHVCPSSLCYVLRSIDLDTITYLEIDHFQSRQHASHLRDSELIYHLIGTHVKRYLKDNICRNKDIVLYMLRMAAFETIEICKSACFLAYLVYDVHQPSKRSRIYIQIHKKGEIVKNKVYISLLVVCCIPADLSDPGMTLSLLKLKIL